ncbi:hypothetical protein D9758_010287 [Tetrapyrgos nigripes]|uniref:BTB domain-containing protein n=1 Tax=Tetrapyrgos nigripes TaxID=182062 RepID=A0A8H5LL88_9AGAR|nr:hypothetical protein D9758_010287 [Tetrapyrgos nigripes]
MMATVNNSTSAIQQQLSTLFSPESGGDIVFHSSDNVLFYVHQKHIEAYAEGFPLAKHTTTSSTNSETETISLTETSSTLELLFQFMRPQNPPELDGLNFAQLMELANASEKYVAYFARGYCAFYMKEYISTNTRAVFDYAVEHGHKNLLYDLAPLMVLEPLEELAFRLPHDVLVAWSIYHSNFIQTLSQFITICRIAPKHSTVDSGSGTLPWHVRMHEVKEEIVLDPRKLSQFGTLILQPNADRKKVCECDLCKDFKLWRLTMCNLIKKMPDIKTIARNGRTQTQ